MSNIRILAETMGSRKERYEMVLDGGGAEEEDETTLALGTRLANKEIRVSELRSHCCTGTSIIRED